MLACVALSVKDFKHQMLYRSKSRQLLSIAALNLLVTAGLSQGPSDPTKLAKESWQKACRLVFAKSKSAVILDVPIDTRPSPIPNQAKLTRFLVAYGRKASFNSDVILVTRDPLSLFSDAVDAQSKLVDSLARLDPAMVERAAKDGIKLSELPRSLQSAIIEYAEIGGSIRDAYASGSDPLIRLYEAPTAKFVSPKDGSNQEVGLGYLSSGTPKERARLERLAKSPSFAPNGEDELLTRDVMQNSKYDFDFGEGEIISVGVLNIRLRRFPGKHLSFDSRFFDQPIYVQGKVSASSLSAALKEITTAQTPKESPYESRTLRDSYDQVMSLVKSHTDLDSFFGLNGLNPEEYRNGNSMSISELKRLAPHFQSTVGSKYEFDSGQTARLGTKLGLGISIPGFLPPPGSTIPGGTYLIRP